MKKMLGMGFILAVLLTGCLDYEETLSINADGSAKVTVEYGMDESIMSMGGTNDLPMKMDKESIEYEIGTGSGIEVISIATNTTNGKFVVKTVASIKDINAVSNTWIFKDRGMKLSSDANEMVLTMSITNATATSADTNQDETTKAMMNSMFANNKIVYRVVMPSAITKFSPTNGVMTNDTVTWAIPMTEYMNMQILEFSVSCNKSTGADVPMLAIIIGIGVLVIVALVLVISRMSQK